MALFDSLKNLKLLKSVKAADNLAATLKTLMTGDIQNVTISTDSRSPAPEDALATLSGDVLLDLEVSNGMTIHFNLKGIRVVLDD